MKKIFFKGVELAFESSLVCEDQGVVRNKESAGNWSAYLKGNKVCFRTTEEEFLKVCADMKLQPPKRR